MMATEILETERLKAGHGKLQLEEYDVMKILEEIIIEFEDKKPGVSLFKINDPVMLKIDRKRIKIVFRNVIENAFRYSKYDSNPVEKRIKNYNDTVEFIVKDDGIGIPEESN